MTTRLTRPEANALRHADTLDDTTLADNLVDVANAAALGIATVTELHQLAAHALIVARRFEHLERARRRADREHDGVHLELVS